MNIEFQHNPDGTITIERKRSVVEFGVQWDQTDRMHSIQPCEGGAALFNGSKLVRVFTSPESAMTWAKEYMA